MNELTDDQIEDILEPLQWYEEDVEQDARHLEELNAYAMTVSNLRADIAGRGVPDGWRLVPVEPDATQIMEAAKAAKQYFDECGGNSPTVIYRAMLAEAPQPAAQPEPLLYCDVCGVETPDPWHFSAGESRHMHSCDACWFGPIPKCGGES